jgi:glycine C-acetyltransferase
VSYLRQRSRPYLFSNSLPPLIAIGAVKALELVDEQPELRARLWENTRYFRERMTGFGFELIPGDHPIVPVMLRDELKTVEMAAAMNRRGVFVVGFNYPVVPRGAARIRVQVSAAHTRTELDKALDAFQDVGAELGLI